MAEFLAGILALGLLLLAWYLQVVIGGTLALLALSVFFVWIHVTYIHNIYVILKQHAKFSKFVFALGVIVYVSSFVDGVFIADTHDQASFYDTWYFFLPLESSHYEELFCKIMVGKWLCAHVCFMLSAIQNNIPDSRHSIQSSYLHQQSFLDINSVFHDAQTKLHALSNDVFTIQEGKDSEDIKIFWPMRFIVHLTQLLSILLTTMVLGFWCFIFGMCVGISWIIFRYTGLVLYMGEIVYKRLFDQTYICTQANCYEEGVQGSIVCSSCGQKHADLYPGRGGIFFATCNCGHSIPVSIFSKKMEQSHVCSGCETSIGNMLDGTKLKVLVYDTTKMGEHREPLAHIDQLTNVRSVQCLQQHQNLQHERQTSIYPIVSTYKTHSPWFVNHILHIYFVQNPQAIDDCASHNYLKNCSSVVLYLEGNHLHTDVDMVYRLIGTLEYHDTLERKQHFTKDVVVVFLETSKQNLYNSKEEQVVLFDILKKRFAQVSYFFAKPEIPVNRVISQAIQRYTRDIELVLVFVKRCFGMVVLSMMMVIGSVCPFVIVGGFVYAIF